MGGKQPLHYAMNSSDRSPDIIKILVRCRASIEARDNMGLTPLMIGAALQSTLAVNALLGLGAARIGFDAMGRTPLDHANQLRPARKEIPCSLEDKSIRSYALKDATPRIDQATAPRTEVPEIAIVPPLDDRCELDDRSRDLPGIIDKASPSNKRPQREVKYLSWHTDVPRCLGTLPRWDHMGSTDVQRNVLRAERVWRNQPCKEFGVTVAERDRLHSAT